MVTNMILKSVFIVESSKTNFALEIILMIELVDGQIVVIVEVLVANGAGHDAFEVSQGYQMS